MHFEWQSSLAARKLTVLAPALQVFLLPDVELDPVLQAMVYLKMFKQLTFFGAWSPALLFV